jgi:hypothetical protein
MHMDAPTIDSRPKHAAKLNGHAAGAAVTVEDFRAYMVMHNYIFVPTRELWPAASVNARCQSPTNPDGSAAMKKIPQTQKDGTTGFKEVPMQPTEWLDEHHAVEQMTWAPGRDLILKDQLIAHGGIIRRPGCATFNLYRPPTVNPGDAALAGPWLEHGRRVFADDFEHIEKWLAHRVQRPGEKINHALVLSGPQGTGKDSLLEPVKQAVGPWNFEEVSPSQLQGRFNGFVKAVILRISEARDLGEVDRYGFYEHMKVYCAAPPDVLRCDEKNLREHSVLNVCGAIITTNHKSDGIYLPADDRRHYVAWTQREKGDFDQGYWRDLWAWYAAGGTGHVAAYLAALDLSDFDAKAPPPKTAAFWEIVDSNRAPEDAELADALDVLDNPQAVTIAMLDNPLSDADFRAWLTDRRNRRQIPHRLETAGYLPVRNSAAADGLWKIGRKRQVIYAQKSLCERDALIAAQDLVTRSW